MQIKCQVTLTPFFRKKQQWCDIFLQRCPTVNQVSKILRFILMAQASGSIDFDYLFVSISALTFFDFAFCQVESRYKWYPLDAILLSNEYILLTCYDTKKLVLLKISVKWNNLKKFEISEFSNSNAKLLNSDILICRLAD